MNPELKSKRPGRLNRGIQTAADIMTTGPLSVAADATVDEATAFLIEKGFGAAPVIDEAGRPVGVLSQSDLLVHEREQKRALKRGEHRDDLTLVRDVMTPGVFMVTPDTAVKRVTEEMATLNVHRLFVVDGHGVLVGVITALDVMRHLELTWG